MPSHHPHSMSPSLVSLIADQLEGSSKRVAGTSCLPASSSSSSSSSSMDAQGAGSSANVFQMPHIPALRFPSPPPPQPQVPSAYSSSYASPYPRHHPSITSLPILVLTVLGILTATVLLLTYYFVVVRCCLSWHGSSDAGGGGATASSSSSSRPVAAETRGLEESIVHALPTFRYSNKAVKSAAAAADSAPASECAVCLSEFEEDDRVRMLPSCLHAFHVDCIDAWLHGNANCPLCRSSIAFTAPCIVPLDQQLRRPDEAVIQVAATRTEVGVLANNIVHWHQHQERSVV